MPPSKPKSYKEDVQLIMQYYTEQQPTAEDEEYIEDEKDNERVKHYKFDGKKWVFQGHVLRALIDVEGEDGEVGDGNGRETDASTGEEEDEEDDDLEPGPPKMIKPVTVSVTVPAVARHGCKVIVNGLAVIASRIAAGKLNKAMAKIQMMLDDMDGGVPRQKKKEPSPYNLFVAEHTSRLKREYPDMTHAERMKIVTNLWNAAKERVLMAQKQAAMRQSASSRHGSPSRPAR